MASSKKKKKKDTYKSSVYERMDAQFAKGTIYEKDDDDIAPVRSTASDDSYSSVYERMDAQFYDKLSEDEKKATLGWRYDEIAPTKETNAKTEKPVYENTISTNEIDWGAVLTGARELQTKYLESSTQLQAEDLHPSNNVHFSASNSNNANPKAELSNSALDAYLKKYGVKSVAELETKANEYNAQREDTEKDKTWFQKGAFEDGYQFGDVTKTAVGTGTDILENVATAVVDATENLIDTAAYGVGVVGGLFDDDFQDDVGKFISKEILQPKKTGETIVKYLTPLGAQNDLLNGGDTESASLLGDKADGLVQSGAHLAGSMALQTVGVPMWLTMGVNAFGSEIEQAYQNDATHTEAGISGAVSTIAEIVFERISGGIKFKGMGTLDDGIVNAIKNKISNKVGRAITKYAVQTVGEGAEEVATEYASAVGRKLTYMDDKEFNEIISTEDALDAFVGGVVMGGVAGGGKMVNSATTGRDFVTDLTANEEKVVKKIHEDEIAKREANGDKLSFKEKNDLWDKIVKKMERGYIDTDTIESVLGGDDYKSYKSAFDGENALVEQEKALQKEYKELNAKKWSDMTGEEQDRREELKKILPELQAKIDESKKSGNTNQLKSQLSQSVYDMVKGKDRLVESYLEKVRAEQDYVADLDKFKGRKHEDAAKKTIENAIKAGANNTNAVHDIVDMAADLSSETGYVYDFKDGDQIKQDFIERKTEEIAQLEAVENPTEEQTKKITALKELVAQVQSGEVTVNGNVDTNGIVLNLDSAKPLNRIVGHEITHTVEKAKHYNKLRDSLFAYAKSKGVDIDAELKMKALEYEGVEGTTAEAELVADLVGDYLFTDSDFVKQLSTEHRNVAQRIYDEIKYLISKATQGSKEERELLRVKHEFEKAFRESAEVGNKPQKVAYSFGVTQEDINNYVDAAYENENDEDYKKYAEVSERLLNDVSGDVDLNGYAHAMRDNDIRHIRNSHGENTPEKYPITKEDMKNIPWLVENYDKVLVVKRNDGRTGLVYVKTAQDGLVYYLEQVTTKYGNEPLLINKQMIKTGIDDIPKLPGLKDAITKKQSEIEFLDDLKKVPKVYAQSVYQSHSIDSVAEKAKSVNSISDDSDTKSSFGKDGDFNIENYTLEDMLNFTDEQFDAAYKALGLDEYFKDDEWIDETELFGGDVSVDSISEELNTEPEKIEILVRREGLGKSHIEENRTAVMKQERIDRDIADSGARFTPDYAQKYITKISPKDFIDLTVMQQNQNRERFDSYVEGDSGSTMNTFDYESALQDSKQTPYLVIDRTTGQIIGHNGRHRMRALEMAGIESAEIEVELHDEDGAIIKYNAETIPDMAISSQFDTAIETHLSNIIPLNEAHRGEIESTYGEKAHANAGVKYSLSKNAQKADVERFSLSKTVERTKDLVAVHNLQSSELMKTIELGGLAMPSIAIIKAEQGHDKYGDVSLIFRKETIDPKQNSANKVYGGDAWTPTHPRLEYKVNDSVQQKIKDKYYALADKVGYDTVRPLYRYVSELEGALNSDGGETALLERLYDDTKMMQVYLEDSGKGKVEDIVKETRVEATEVDKERNQWFIDKLGEDVIREFATPDGESAIEHRKAFVAKYKDEIASAWESLCRNVYNSTEEQVQNIMRDTTNGMYMRFVKDAAYYLNTGGITIKTETDYDATNKAIKEKASDGYKAWVDNLFKGVEEKTGIRNDKDVFTSSGNRRSWDALHWENTLENVVRAMKAQDQTGADAFAPSSALFAVAHKKYGSIGEIKADSERLGRVSEDEYKAMEQEYALRLAGIAESIKDTNRNSFMAVDKAAELIEDAVRNYKTKTGMLRYMKKWNERVTESTVDDVVSLVNDIANMPTGYFEAKPQRAVGLDEVGVFVIPRNTDAKLKQELLNKGYSIAEYDPNIEGDRQQVVNRFEEYKFSLSNANEDIAPIGNFDFYGKDFKVKPSAPTQDTNSPITEDIAPVDADMFRDDYSPEADRELSEMDRKAYLDSVDDADAPPKFKEYDDVLKDSIAIDNKSLKQLSKRIGDSLELNRAARKELEKVIQDFSQDEFATKETIYEKIWERFSTQNEEIWRDDVATAKDYIRNHGIYVSPVEKADFLGKKGYTDFMRSNFGKIKFSKNGTPVDVFYEDLRSEVGHLFPEDIITSQDRLMRIAEVANMPTVDLIPTRVADEQLLDVANMIYDSVNEYHETERMVTEKGDVSNWDDIAPMPDAIAPMTEEEANAVQDAKAQADAKLEGEPKTRKQLHSNIINDFKATFSSGGYDLDDVLKKAKNLSTLSTVDNTPQRVMEKALGYKEGQILADLTVNKVAQNETKGIKWLNNFTDRKNGLIAQISKQYNIKPASKESAAAQMYAEGFYVNDNNDIVAYGDAELAKDFPNAKIRNNIKGLASDPRIRQIYDETLNAINESRKRNAYPEIQRLDNYYLHFRAMTDTFSKLGLPFNPNDIRAKDLPTDLNGVTADLKPGQPYFASANHRMGKRTSFDLLGGLEQYLTAAKNQIYHIDDIQNLRALRNYIADTYGQANGLEGIDALTEEEAQERIEQVYGSHLSTFAKFLNEEANVLAGKTALIDRGLEGIIGRRGMTFLDTVNRQVGSNMVGFNISSSLTNFIPVAQTFAKTNKFDFTKAFAQTVSNKIGSIFGKGDNFAENSPVVIRRKGADRFYRTPFQKVADSGYVLMSAVDDISTELIARTKFNEFTRKGMSEQQAHFETDKWVSRLMGDRSLGQMPQLYNSKTLGVITKFQLEVRNQLDAQFYDTIQEAKVSNEDIENALARNAKTAAKVTSTFVQLAVVQHLFGKAFESVAGYNPAFDIIGVLATMFGFDDDEESEDTVGDNIEQGFLELMEDLPYTSVLTGGRVPMSAALPITELVKGTDSYGNEKSRLETLGEAAPYYVLPTGYGQIKKTAQGLGMFSDEHPVAGSYTDSGNLRYPVDDTIGNKIQAGIFGQYANENAREYFDNGYAPLKEKQIQEYVDVELPIADYWDYREGLKGLKSNAEKADYINSLDIEDWQKNLLMNNILDRKEDVDMSNYDDYGSYEEFDYAQKNPEKYAFAKSVGGYSSYQTYSDDLNGIKADKDINGKSITGSRKQKVLDYINNLDADYETKIILFKSEYPSDDTYNADIINYLNNRADLTYDELVSIYTELGFEVKDGYVYWD